MHTNIHNYLDQLNDEIDNRFPNTKRVIISGGDYIKDIVMELREDSNRMQYSPHELFVNSGGNYEESIMELCNAWSRIICKKGKIESEG